jgi:hypothetical protein
VSIGLGFKLIGSKQMLFQTIQSSVIAGAQSILEAANTPTHSLVPSLSSLAQETHELSINA